MTRNRITLYWLLLSVLLFTGSLLSTVTESQARYVGTAASNTLLEYTSADITSDCLVTGQDAPMTVLVGQIPMDRSTPVTFWVKSSGDAASGKLAWAVKESEYAEYLNLSVMSGMDPVDSSMDIELLKDVEMAFTLNISPSPIARTTPHGPLKIHVLVTWGNDMWGTFQVLLPAVAGDPDETTAAAETAAEIVETTAETTESTEATTETTAPAEQETPADIGMATLRSFAQAEPLPLKIALTRDVTKVKLGLWVEETLKETAEDGTVTETVNTVLSPFPDNTRFSLNGGESYYMLTDGCVVELDLASMTELSVLLDFSHAKLSQEEKLTLAMEAWAGETLLASRDASTVPDVVDLWQMLTHSQAAETTGEGETEEPTEPSSAATGWESKVLNRNNYLELVLPLHWWEADLEYTVDILTLTEAGSPEYRPVSLSESGLTAKRTNYGGVHNLEFRIGEKLPQAGTYRVNMTWKYKDICFAKTQTTFFINYSAFTSYTLGS